MAKGARASTVKANNARLKDKVFGPVETARTERLSAKLLELASQPKPSRDGEDFIAVDSGDVSEERGRIGAPKTPLEKEAMDVDTTGTKTVTKASKGRIEKRRVSKRKSSMVFPKFKDGKKSGSKSKRR